MATKKQRERPEKMIQMHIDVPTSMHRELRTAAKKSIFRTSAALIRALIHEHIARVNQTI
jgi:hypothetical protein